MKLRRSILAALMCVIITLMACVPKEKEEKNQSEKAEQNTEKTEQSEEEKMTEDGQAKLDVINPSAYRNADGIHLEPGSYISIIGKAQEGAFWEEVKKGAEAAIEEINDNLGYEGRDKVKITYNGPAEAENVDEQVNILDEELARYPIAVAISIVDTQACEVQFDLAAENDIPVVAFDSGSEYKGLQAMAATDNKKVAAEAAVKMSELVGEGGKVVVLANDSKSETALVRESAFTKAVKSNHRKITVAGVYHLDEMQKTVADEVNAGDYVLSGETPTGKELSEGDRVTPESVTQENILDYILRKNPDIKGIYATNSNTVNAAADALERNKVKDVSVIGYDIDEDEKKALQDGKVAALAVQNPYGMGYASVISAARAALGIGNEAYINTGYTWVTKDNFTKKDIEKMLY